MNTPIEQSYNALNNVNIQLTNQEKELKRLRMVEAKYKGLLNTNEIYRTNLIAAKEVNENSQQLICEKDITIKHLMETVEYLKRQNFKSETA